MADMPSILSSLSRLWSGWRRRWPFNAPLDAPAARHVVPVAAGELETNEEHATPSTPAALEDDDDQDEDELDLEEADDEPEDELTPDPFITATRPTPAEFSSDELEQRRSEAMAAALIGEHKILLSDLAGPGTLAEALNRLLQEGRVTAQFRDDGAEEPHLIYCQKP
jgi:hypothetical protein